MTKGFLISILFLVSGIVFVFVPFDLPNGGMAEIFGTKIPAWLGFMVIGIILYFLTDRGPTGRWIKDITNKIIRKKVK